MRPMTHRFLASDEGWSNNTTPGLTLYDFVVMASYYRWLGLLDSGEGRNDGVGSVYLGIGMVHDEIITKWYY